MDRTPASTVSACREIFWRFGLLGCTSFGGPAAHLGYFRTMFVERLAWLDDAAYARLVALSQFLPGPGSSQVGFAIGLERAGLPGGIAAFVGFTTPSFLLMASLGAGALRLADAAWFPGLVAGLKLLAVVVVADATRGMWISFCTTRRARLIAALCAAALLLVPGVATQLAVLVLAILVGSLSADGAVPAAGGGYVQGGEARRVRILPLAFFGGLFPALLVGLPLLGGGAGQTADVRALLGDFYAAGALVFGGGHVVLPLLQEFVGDAFDADGLLTGYAAAQAVPGPMFTFVSFLGAQLAPASLAAALGSALLATLAIFLPGLLLVLALREAWHGLAARPRFARGAAAANAAVVGLLFAALCRPVVISSVQGFADAACVLVGLALLRWARPPILMLVVAFASYGLLSPR